MGPHALPTGLESEREAIVLHRGGRTWRFVWSESDVPEFIQTVTDLAENDDIDLDWFDAALVIYELGRRLERHSERTGSGVIRSSEARP